MTTEKPAEESKQEAEEAEEAEEEEVKAEEPEAEAAEPKKEEEPTEAKPTAEMPSPPPPGLEERRDLWDTAATYLKKAKDEVVRSSRIGKIRLDIARLKKQRRDLLSEFGEKAYELLSAGKLSTSSEELEELKVKVDEKNALIAAKEAEIEAIAAEEAAEAEEEAKTE